LGLPFPDRQALITLTQSQRVGARAADIGLLARSWPRQDGTSHLLAVGGVGALIDPVDTQRERMRQTMRCMGVRAVFELHTCAEVERSPVANQRYTRLLRNLGASLDLDVGLDAPEHSLEIDGPLVVRPLDRMGDTLNIEVGLDDVELTAGGSLHVEVTPQGARHARSRPCGSLSVQLGGASVQLLLLDGARMAWACGGRVFVPGPLGRPLPKALAQLPPETLIYGSAPGPWLSSVQQEQVLGGTWPG
jgi:hypothetical protein